MTGPLSERMRDLGIRQEGDP
ncbi:MAG: hypothetical protein JWM17_1857, partial [Actinobacteria bacterium]|nr:hypothetical protein [Actinomycetota bacterium]